MPNDGTTVQYNGVIMRNVVTREWDEEIEYDESGTDIVRHHHTLRFEGIIHNQIVADDGQSPVVATQPFKVGVAVASEVEIRRLLLQARKNLQVTINGTTLLLVTSSENTSLYERFQDTKNGPKPRGLQITKIISDKVFRVVWSVECWTSECPGGKPAGAGKFVLNNRWSVTENMDENFFVTRVISGRLQISTSSISAHSLRGYALHPLEDGFKRSSFTYVVSKDGLAADYQVVDRQVHTAAPWPATSIVGTHTESTADGVTFLSAVDVTLTGPPHADKRWLITRAVQVVDSRLRFLSKQQDQENERFFITNAAIIDHIGEQNVIEMHVAIRRFEEPGYFLAHLQAGTLGTPVELPSLTGPPKGKKKDKPDYDRRRSTTPATYGYDPQGGIREPVVLFLLKCYLQSPCSTEHGFTLRNNSDNTEDYEPSDPPSVTGSQIAGPLPPSKEGRYDPDVFKSSIYDLYRYESSYHHDRCNVHMPLASARPDGSTSLFFEIAPGMASRVIVVEAERIGAWPELPSPEENYVNGAIKGRLLEFSVTSQVPGITPDGNKGVYSLRAKYVYGLSRPPSSSESIHIGKVPFLKLRNADNSLPQQLVYNKKLGP